MTGLGWFDEFADGLIEAHEVGLWDPSGTLLASVVVPSGTSAPLDGQFRTVGITPLNLAVGAGYIVGGLNSSTNTERLAANVTQVVDPRIAFVDATFSGFAASLERPTNFSVATSGFYGPSFSVSGVVIPEPTSLILAGLGFVGLITAHVGRRRANP